MNILKRIAKKLLLKKVPMLDNRKLLYTKLPGLPLSERSLRYGKELKRVESLQMEAAPGVTETVVTLLEPLPMSTSILDYGCGQHQSQYIQKLGLNVHSCDVIDFKKNNFTKINPTARTLPFQDNQFDIVIASELLEHVWSPWLLMEEFIRIAKHRIIITTPNVVSLQSKKVFSKSGYLQWFEPKDFSYHLSPIFYWQMEEFCKSHSITLSQTIGNHVILGLPDNQRPLDYAEALIFDILV